MCLSPFDVFSAWIQFTAEPTSRKNTRNIIIHILQAILAIHDESRKTKKRKTCVPHTYSKYLLSSDSHCLLHIITISRRLGLGNNPILVGGLRAALLQIV
ncbi:hypothetical protein G7K_5496-t1 [Saitoella complicata NRRL Y-17804]|uniref:Uncharacterized protein n=1 Tax=Saitoella complicata (strain BCRC 22490 / CBS 7301 / JCM 7358 / NBRC 10748 / NRRL Y-17804) TaxID=698492 RepID=A0A0E9NNJ2_SAICN|nr:hypothetical protein G7K_5496-t1 [Saitoella complicata NRRL Y-17804]